ncbi:hypothetical protein CSUB01_05327 [Colletotrichum sublineola]|uniref:Uncharacterized protein n=1 Tax=Colletotrichum sublineola TaxID=1173701 RepID=A0A066X3N6_COLSU|nr:hypothetical protein CSUB01_05327 [Colletotrichum sublineola]
MKDDDIICPNRLDASSFPEVAGKEFLTWDGLRSALQKARRNMLAENAEKPDLYKGPMRMEAVEVFRVVDERGDMIIDFLDQDLEVFYKAVIVTYMASRQSDYQMAASSEVVVLEALADKLRQSYISAEVNCLNSAHSVAIPLSVARKVDGVVFVVEPEAADARVEVSSTHR